LILKEAERLYIKLTTKLTNEVIAINAAMKTISSLQLSVTNNKQNDTYQIEEPR
jgi:hypothetical protein